MSLRFKSLLIFAAAVTLLFAIVLVFAKIVIERQFNEIEIAQMAQKAEQFSAGLKEETYPLISTAGDWAAWDELYDYVNGTNPRFPEINIPAPTLPNLRLDFFAVFRQSGDLQLIESVPAPLLRAGITNDAIVAAIREQGLIPQTDIDLPVSGPLLAGSQVLLAVAIPIVHRDHTGPPVGTLVIGRILTPGGQARADKLNGYRVRFVPAAPPSASAAGNVRPGPGIRIVDARQIVAEVPIIDLHGHWIATAELTSERPLNVQALRTVRIFVIGMASAAGILLFVVWYLLDTNVMFPVRQLANRLTEAGNRGELPSDLGLKGGNELADLARRIEDLARSVARAEANYRAIVEDQTEFIMRYLPSGRITFVNQALCRYFGLTREDLIDRDAHRFVAEEDVGRIASSLRTLSLTNPVVTIDHHVLTPTGETAWFRRTDRGIFSEGGELREIQCVARDITLTHLTYKRLEASETRYRRLFETANDGILIVRQFDHAIADANPSLCRLLDANRMSLLGQPVDTLYRLPNLQVLGSLPLVLNGSPSVRETEIVLSKVDGERIYVEVSSRVYETGGDTVIQSNFRDISLRRRASDELRQLSGHLLRSQDEERRRIARELHDSTAQTLSALQMALTQLTELAPDTLLASPKARSILDDIRSLNDASLREIRTLSYLLHPPLLDEVGLLFALRWYVNGFITRTEIIVRLDAPETLDRLPSEVETAIFRVAQEGLSNIHRHSGSRLAWIRLAVDDRIITLEIRDEGNGMTPAPAGPYPPGYPVLGVGIAGMRERMRQFGGSLTLESSSRGTTIRATLPLPPDDDPRDR